MPSKRKPDPEARRKAAEAEAKLKLAQDRKRRRAMGPALKLSDAALDQAALVTEADKESAFAFWRKHASPKFRDLLDAQVVE